LFRRGMGGKANGDEEDIQVSRGKDQEGVARKNECTGVGPWEQRP